MSASAVTIDENATHQWWLYLLACRDGRTYAGIAIDVVARFDVHANGKGAKFTRANRPVAILGAQAFATKPDAMRAEHALKQMSKPEKLAWAQRFPFSLADERKGNYGVGE